jgi:hypothetical protein
MDEGTPVSVARFVAGALATALVLNLVLDTLFGFSGVPVTMGVAFFAAGLAAWWFARSVRRAPTRQERGRFLWSYGGIVALPFIAIAFLAVSRGAASVPGLFILFLYYIPYPAFAQMFFSEKYFAMALKK